MERPKHPKKPAPRAASVAAAEERVLRRSGLPDPRAEPDPEGAATSAVYPRSREHGASVVVHEREGRGSGLAPANTTRLLELEKSLDEARRERDASIEKVHELERTIERMKRDRAVDEAKIGELSAEIARVEHIAKGAAQALEGVARALDAVEHARIDASDARAAALEALSKLIG